MKNLMLALCALVCSQVASAEGYHQLYLYTCPTAEAYQVALMRGKEVIVCPNGVKPDPNKKPQCRHAIYMHAYLKGYGGYPPENPWEVTKSTGYYHKQCAYEVRLMDGAEMKHLPGYFLISDKGRHDCRDYPVDKKNSLVFQCKPKHG